MQTRQYLSEGLVDSSSDEEFDEKLSILREKWERLQELLSLWSQESISGLSSTKLKSTMLKIICEEAGLVLPLDIFSTNASVMVNSIIKAHMQRKSNQPME